MEPPLVEAILEDPPPSEHLLLVFEFVLDRTLVSFELYEWWLHGKGKLEIKMEGNGERLCLRFLLQPQIEQLDLDHADLIPEGQRF